MASIIWSRPGNPTQGVAGALGITRHQLRHALHRLKNNARLMRELGLEADIDCFWHGEHGATPPEIPEETRAAFAKIGAKIEKDFDTD